jgi:hypothetical protein
MVPGTLWLSVHLAISFASACLPTYRPLLDRIQCLKLATTPQDQCCPGCKPSIACPNLTHKPKENSTDSFNATLLESKPGTISSSAISYQSPPPLLHGQTRQVYIPSPTDDDDDDRIIPNLMLGPYRPSSRGEERATRRMKMEG